MKAFRFILLAACMMPFLPVNGQKQLMIEKPGKTKRVIILPGTEIRFQLKGDNRTYRREIIALKDSSIVFSGFEIRLEEIGMIHMPLNPHLKTYSETIIAGGVILFIADQINNSIIDDKDWSLNQGVTIASISLVSAGILIRFLQKRTFKFPGKRKLKII